MDTHLLDLEAVVDSLRFERFALMGFSHSCPAAIAFAARFPERVTHLVLWNGYANAADYARASRVEAARSLIEQDWQLYTESEGYRFTEWSGGEDAKWYTEYIRQSVTPETLRAMFDLIRGTNVTDLLPEVAAPTLVLHRRELSVLTVETAKDLTASIPDARLIIVDGVSIAPFMEGTTEVVVGAIDAFLAETGAPSATAPPSDVSPAALTPRETEILALIARGRSSADVSRELSLSIRTVGRHITNIYTKIDARTRAEATAYAIRHGLTSSGFRRD
jgi:DNA-binding CsgD family transcriptional regulator